MAKKKTEKLNAADRKAADVKAKAKAAALVRPMPDFYDAENQLKTLKANNFPTTREGKMLYCDYQVEKWGVKKIAIEKSTDPMAKKKKKRDRLQAELKKLETELQEAEGENVEDDKGDE